MQQHPVRRVLARALLIALPWVSLSAWAVEHSEYEQFLLLESEREATGRKLVLTAD